MRPETRVKKAEIRLRTAAIEFAEHVRDTPKYMDDPDGKKRNRKLLRAAEHYAAVKAALREEDCGV